MFPIISPFSFGQSQFQGAGNLFPIQRQRQSQAQPLPPTIPLLGQSQSQGQSIPLDPGIPIGQGQAQVGGGGFFPGPAPNDGTYTFTQLVPAAVWTITHNLAGFPSVALTDPAGNVVIAQVQYPNSNQVIATFTPPFAGNAFLNL
jgi:hypothetical protein